MGLINHDWLSLIPCHFLASDWSSHFHVQWNLSVVTSIMKFITCDLFSNVCLMTEGTNLLVLTISAFWSSSRCPLATEMSSGRQRSIPLGGRYRQVSLYFIPLLGLTSNFVSTLIMGCPSTSYLFAMLCWILVLICLLTYFWMSCN